MLDATHRNVSVAIGLALMKRNSNGMRVMSVVYATSQHNSMLRLRGKYDEARFLPGIDATSRVFHYDNGASCIMSACRYLHDILQLVKGSSMAFDSRIE